MDGVREMDRERDGKERSRGNSRANSSIFGSKVAREGAGGQQQHYTGCQNQTTTKGESDREEDYWSGGEEEATEGQQVSGGEAEVIATALRVW